MSVFSKESEQRIGTQDLPSVVDPKVLGHLEGQSRMPREKLPAGTDGRIVIEAESDVFPAAEEIAGESKENAKAVAAFLLQTVCGWRLKAITLALGYSDPDDTRPAGACVRRGAELVREGTTRA